MKKKNRVAASDCIFASLHNGEQTLNIKVSGFSTLEEIVRHVVRSCARFISGTVVLQLRNATQGWTLRHCLTLA